MTNLSVNINKIATLRNARGGNMPNVVQAAIDCQRFGADGITIHPRPDERHITNRDVYEIKEVINTEFNIEGYPSEKFVKMVLDVKPEQVTLVPDAIDVITSNNGWNTIENQTFLTEIIGEFKNNNIRTSIFVNPQGEMVEGAKKCGSDRVELYTESYANIFETDRSQAIKSYINAAEIANKCNLEINAGHDLNLENLPHLKECGIIDEVSIGHAIMTDALKFGFSDTIMKYIKVIRNS